jgi:hypothetical protein
MIKVLKNVIKESAKNMKTQQYPLNFADLHNIYN